VFDSSSDGLSERERDRVLNAETRRALRRAARLFGVAAVGMLTAVITLSLAAATAILSPPWQLHVAVTVIVGLALPVAIPYAMLRVYGLANRDMVYVAKRAYREVVAEIIALSGTSTASVAFDESGTAEAADGASHSPEEGGSDDAIPGSESGESTDKSSTDSEPTDLHQQTDPQPQS
jgi:hypothetical protein